MFCAHVTCSSLCRQVVIDMNGGQLILDVPIVNITMAISADHNTIASIVSTLEFYPGCSVL